MTWPWATSETIVWKRLVYPFEHHSDEFEGLGVTIAEPLRRVSRASRVAWVNAVLVKWLAQASTNVHTEWDQVGF